MASAVFERDGDTYVPSEIARGPWDPNALHGGAPCALLATLLARADGGEAMALARLTFELLKPVPIAPLQARTAMIRPGRRVQLVQGELLHAGTAVARAVALRIRREDGAGADAGQRESLVPPVPGPQQASGPPGAHGPMFATHGVEIRFAEGEFAAPGPATAWIRLRTELIAGEAPEPAARVAAAADFGNGVSAALPWGEFVFINPDLTVYLEREPAGEWVALESRTAARADGRGLTDSALHDERGPIGRALQALYLARR